MGLSPRVRGNLLWKFAGTEGGGSIPARAGEPASHMNEDNAAKVYPRACGGTTRALVARLVHGGLSPRVRGNHSRTRSPAGPWGSIPARAGEPLNRTGCPGLQWVYPRACGGTLIIVALTTAIRGLSPRVRGNHHLRKPYPRCRGSIPARAGEPGILRPRGRGQSVYPRACGGTSAAPYPSAHFWGLSPRVRGNQRPGRPAFQPGRSIPARAGEPNRPVHRDWRLGVYPRACGGTYCRILMVTSPVGLSPRVRGNQTTVQHLNEHIRSIPARAGEPGPSFGQLPCQKVYPRACGGTRRVACRLRSSWGLSPRVRGNHAGRNADGLPSRSIPARAGEPAWYARRRCHCAVYPRACGGTSAAWTAIRWSRGLSPRVRGNRSGAR